MNPAIIAALIITVLLLGTVIIPAINKNQFNKLSFEQKVRILMKEANGLIYFKNVASNNEGKLYYVKNKRRIYIYPWVMSGGNMLCTREDLFICWDYPDEEITFTEEEITQALEELEKYNSKNKVKLIINYEAEQ